MTNEIVLKPCPFCGGSAEIIDLGDPDDDSYAHCLDCGVQQIADYTEREASRKWNTRVEASGHAELVAKAQAVVDAYNADEEAEARAILDLRDALANKGEQPSVWQPIETAPKDGTSILGGYFNQPWAESHREGRVEKCWFQPEFDAFISSCREMTMAPGYSFGDGTTRKLHSPVVEQVTHWMPLPEPPAGEQP